MIRERLPNRRRAELLDFEHGGLSYTAGISRFADGRIAEGEFSWEALDCRGELRDNFFTLHVHRLISVRCDNGAAS
jgi:hypothetical protein